MTQCKPKKLVVHELHYFCSIYVNNFTRSLTGPYTPVENIEVYVFTGKEAL